jgi:hypothetical protein
MMGMKEEGNGVGGMWLGMMLIFAALPKSVNHETFAHKLERMKNGSAIEVVLCWEREE